MRAHQDHVYINAVQINNERRESTVTKSDDEKEQKEKKNKIEKMDKKNEPNFEFISVI